MRIGIITFHFAHNCGAMLQCWALQKKLIDMDHEVDVINYQPRYHTEQYAIIQNPLIIIRNYIKCNSTNKGLVYNLRGVVSTFFKVLAGNRRWRRRAARKAKFDKFMCSNMHLSKKIKDANGLYLNKLDYDAIICGSDQIWNRQLTDGIFDKVYFATFDNYHGIKVAYGASIGETDIKINSIELNSLLKHFKMISMREDNSAKELSDLLGRLVECVPDPTLLIDKSLYLTIEAHIQLPQRYILLYSLEDSELFSQTADMIACMLKMPVINISPLPISLNCSCQNRFDVGPDEFLAYFSHAEYIITNSFHGTVFSHIFEKQFSAVAHKKRNARIKNLLDKCGTLGTLILNENDISRSLLYQVDYQKTNIYLQHYREIGEAFLKNSLI